MPPRGHRDRVAQRGRAAKHPHCRLWWARRTRWRTGPRHTTQPTPPPPTTPPTPCLPLLSDCPPPGGWDAGDGYQPSSFNLFRHPLDPSGTAVAPSCCCPLLLACPWSGGRQAEGHATPAECGERRRGGARGGQRGLGLGQGVGQRLPMGSNEPSPSAAAGSGPAPPVAWGRARATKIQRRPVVAAAAAASALACWPRSHRRVGQAPCHCHPGRTPLWLLSLPRERNTKERACITLTLHLCTTCAQH